MRWRSGVMVSSLKGFSDNIRHHSAHVINHGAAKARTGIGVLSAEGGLSSTPLLHGPPYRRLSPPFTCSGADECGHRAPQCAAE